MQKKILVAEDEKDIRNLIRDYFKKDGFWVVEAVDGEEAVEKTISERPDIIVLDLMMPKKDGLTVCRELKQNEKAKNIPILMLTAKSEEIDRVLGFELGADDYLTKPFSVRELLLRVKAIVKRASSSKVEAHEIVSAGDLVMDTTNFEVRIKNKSTNLTKTEFLILKCLLAAKGRVVTKESMTNQVWGFDSYGDSRTIDTHMAKLRKKIGKYGDKIETVRGIGFRFKR